MKLHLPQLIAHRGAPLLAPENTLASLRAAKEHGALWTELDVALTADQVAVVIHDDTLNRTTNGTGYVYQKTYAELAKLDAGSWFNPQFHDCTIPTLSQYLHAAAELQLGVNIELKPVSSRHAPALINIVIATLQQQWPSQLPIPLLSSFSVSQLQLLSANACPYPFALAVNQWQPKHARLALALQCYSIHVNARYVTPACVTINAAHGCQTLAYTVNNKTEAEQLFGFGVNSIFSDSPDLLTTALSNKPKD